MANDTYKMIIRASFSRKIARDARGLGNWNFDFFSGTSISSVVSGACFIRAFQYWRRLRLHQFLGEMLPSPTTFRAVSGTNIIYITKYTPLTMVRNQKIDRHPKNFARMPPMVGPKAGASMIPAATGPRYVPLPAGVQTSAMTPKPSATVPLLP